MIFSRALGIMLMAMGAFSPSFAETPQNSPIYFVDIDAVLMRSKIGQAVNEWRIDEEISYKARSDESIAILEAEEQRLTSIRDEMSLEEFLPLAQNYDTQAEATRTEFQTSLENLQAELSRKNSFVVNNMIRPAIVQLIEDFQAAAIFRVTGDDRILGFDPALDLTEELIARIDNGYTRNKAEFDAIIFSQSENSTRYNGIEGLDFSLGSSEE